MKKKLEEKVMVEYSFCNICNKQVSKDPWNKTRIAVVRGLFKAPDFDAHEVCINKVVREAFKKYI